MRRPFASNLILIAALFIAAGPYVVRAAGTRLPDGSTAMVDLQRVYGESDARKTADIHTGEYARLMGQHFDEIAAMQYLATAEIRDYSDALNADKPTPADMQKMATIKAEAAKRAAEAQALASKKDADLTPADRKRIGELNSMQQQQAPVLGQLQRLYQQMVNEEDAKQTRLGMAEVRTVVAKMAKDQGISQVFDATCLVYTPVDLTTAALAKVAKKK